MMPKAKNIIIFLIIGVLMVLAYIFFIQKKGDISSLISTSPLSSSSQAEKALAEGVVDNSDFLSVLLNVKNIKLNDAILSDLAFLSLNDPKIELKPDGTHGRPNPFAPIGTEVPPSVSAPASGDLPPSGTSPSSTNSSNPATPNQPRPSAR